MIYNKKITCIVCPIGCKINVKMKNGKCVKINGNLCKIGIKYAKNESIKPKRILTTSVLVKNGVWPLVSVKTSKPIPKRKIFFVLKKIKKIKIKAPVYIGQKILSNVENTGIDIIATKTVKKSENK